MAFTETTEPVPAELRTGEFTVRPIVVADTERDYAAVMETREDLRLWRQTAWPEDGFMVEENREDVVDMEERHAAHRAFNYTVVDPAGSTCLGCVYVFPTSATFLAKCGVTAVDGDEWSEVDAVVFFWVRLPQRKAGMDGRLLDALRVWFRDVWKFEKTGYATSETFRQQVELLNGTDLTVKFELDEPGKAGKRLVFG
ncbi:hypothetical protein VSH64_08130 [Amycolatopsis rhabdoformis]|uniref:N-acetyltransferase n=1 Tax=Amycolatopsis rhabdoformis TaxID=1448059 RepID=A0ABZ1IEV3_9PSEU|nr:hypothetical protein [Amycolatopsis rhabdoformis]WSE32074.1 hypothetical protein VSH64_08130 [Amycolatopsis rhabdoformis]